VEAVNAKASRELRFLQKTVKHLRATVAKDKVAQKAAKEKTGAIASIYVANRYNAWKVATLEFMQTLWIGATNSLPPKKEVLQTLTSTFLSQDAELKKNKKNIMQFAAFMYDEVEGGLGKEALDTVLPYDQMQVLTESKEYLSKHLVFGVQLGVTIYDLNAGGDVPGDAKKIGLAEPGKPSMSLAPLDA
jgi:hypothetical protein